MCNFQERFSDTQTLIHRNLPAWPGVQLVFTMKRKNKITFFANMLRVKNFCKMFYWKNKFLSAKPHRILRNSLIQPNYLNENFEFAPVMCDTRNR